MRGKGAGTGDFGAASVDDGDLVAGDFVVADACCCCCSGDERSSLASADVVVVGVAFGVAAAAAACAACWACILCWYSC
jgi:hypothetical protein